MEYAEREHLISRILAGFQRFRVGSEVYHLFPASPADKYVAQQLYHDTLREAQLRGVLSSENMLSLAIANGLWSAQKEERLEGLKRDIEEIKVKLYELTFKSDERKIVRLALRAADDEVEKLSRERLALEHNSCEGTANIARFHHLLLAGLRYDDGVAVDPNIFPHVDQIISLYHDNRIEEEQFRELARTEPWHTMWSVGQTAQGIFGKPACELSDEQAMLCLWSRLYDNVRESSECPHDSIVDDDDMLDGWLILQRRKRDANKLAKQGEDRISKNPKIQNAEEIFVPVNNVADAQRLEALNNVVAKVVKQQRIQKIQKDGTVKEADLPDAQQKIMMQKNRS